MNCRQMLIEQLKAIGADGLCNSWIECGCDIDDLEPCQVMNLDECRAAKLDGNVYVPMEDV